jgi:hypothetical protein
VLSCMCINRIAYALRMWASVRLVFTKGVVVDSLDED